MAVSPFTFKIAERDFKVGDFHLPYGSLSLLTGSSNSPINEFVLAIAGLKEPLESWLRPVNRGLAPPKVDLAPILRGKVRLDGDDLLEIKNQDRAKRIGIIFENTEWAFLCSTVEEDFNYSFAAAGIDPPPPYNLRRYGLFDSRSIAPEFLSGGEQQRLACSGLIERTPRLILADFSSSNVDSNFLQEVLMPWVVREREAGSIFVIRGLDDLFKTYADGFIKVTNTKATYDSIAKYRRAPGQVSANEALSKAFARKPNDGEAEPILSCEGFLAPYAKTKANISLYTQDISLIIGPNGSGKTSFGRAVADGKSRKGLRIGERVVAHMALQHPERCMFETTVIKQLDGSEKLFELCGIDPTEFTAHPLSQPRSKQKLISIASTLNKSRKIAILDEPTLGMDYPDQKRLGEIICYFDELSLIIISHDDDVIKACVSNNVKIHDFGATTW